MLIIIFSIMFIHVAMACDSYSVNYTYKMLNVEFVNNVSNFLFPLQSGRTSSGKSSRSRKASAKSVRSQVSDNETPQDKEGEAKEGDQDGNKLSE